jgi:nicotinamidase-related amidase
MFFLPTHGWVGRRTRLGYGALMSLIARERCCLLVVDVQEKLTPTVENATAVISNARRLAAAARRLAVPILATEQYSKGLGHTVTELACQIPSGGVVEKCSFAASAEEEFIRRFGELQRPQPVLCGMETHVCVLQTALGLQEAGYCPVVVVDAVGSRRAVDRDAALRRLARHGIDLPTTEMVIFEWLRRGPSAEFRDILPLLR